MESLVQTSVTAAGTGGGLAISGKAYRSAVTITRPSDTTAYTAGDVVGDTGGSAIITLSNVGPSGGWVLVQSARLMIGLSAVTSGMTGFRLHFYTASPTAIADNAAFDLVSGDVDDYAGYIDLPTPQDFGSTIVAQSDYLGTLIKLADGSTSLYAQLQTKGAFTPASATEYDLRVLTLEAGV